MDDTQDTRTPAELMRQWDKLNNIRRQLVTQGVLDRDATPDEIIPALRQALPQHLLDDVPHARR